MSVNSVSSRHQYFIEVESIAGARFCSLGLYNGRKMSKTIHTNDDDITYLLFLEIFRSTSSDTQTKDPIHACSLTNCIINEYFRLGHYCER